MKALTSENTTLSMQEKGTKLHVRLSPEQYNLQSLAHYKQALAKREIFLLGEIETADDEHLEIVYHLPEGAKNLVQSAQAATHLERLAMARKCSVLVGWQNHETTIFIHPENLFLISGHLQVAHRGLIHVVEPFTGDFLQQYKALILSIIFPKYDYEALSKGHVHLRDTLSQEIMDAKDAEAIEAIIDKQYMAFYEKRQASERVVNKGRYTFLQWTAGLSVTLAIGLGIGLGMFALDALPQRDRIIESKTAFMTNNFHQAVTTLAQDSPESLPRSAQFILASSFVQLENLTNEQQTAILNHLSVNSSEQELLYWIQIGRGELYDALNTAQIIGDNQLILHAYIRLYDAVYTDIHLPGNERLEKLEQYRERIDELNDLLGGVEENDDGSF